MRKANHPGGLRGLRVCRLQGNFRAGNEPAGNLKKQFQRQDLMKTSAIQGWGEGLVTKAFDEQAWGPELKSPEPTHRQAQ